MVGQSWHLLTTHDKKLNFIQKFLLSIHAMLSRPLELHHKNALFPNLNKELRSTFLQNSINSILIY